MSNSSDPELSVYYNFQDIELKWRQYWQAKQCFQVQINPDSPAYSVVMPPPNITGVLHLGHVLNQTVQDILCRRAKLLGKNVCWVPGTDHASIATEAKVWERLAKLGKNKQNTTRQDFLKAAYEWRAEFGSIIIEQLKRMGLAIDWSREVFTLDEHYSRAVSQVFRDFYDRGWIYRGERMVYWDIKAKTVISDEEVVYSEEDSCLYYIEYAIKDSEEKLLIATRRPETIMGDMAVAVHPEDTRYKHLIGKSCIVPLIGRVIPILADEYVDPKFGSGALKITPAHDFNDYALAEKHNLPKLTIFDQDGCVNENSAIAVGMQIDEAREFIVHELENLRLLPKKQFFRGAIGRSQRTNIIVEPRISIQWFLRMEELTKLALNALETGELKIWPAERFMATYRHWLENPRDWCISRQLWWGHQIPVYYDPKGRYVVAENLSEAVERLNKQYQENWSAEQVVQDEDCLDTWFSSWLWPIEVFRGITQPNNPDFQYFFPTQTLVTGHDIMFFWVARMVMFSMAYTKKLPFNTVYFTGMVRDDQGRKMSKSLGNSPDIITLIEQYGVDALRFSVMIATPTGNDLLFDMKALEQGRNFNNKLWNALKLYKFWYRKLDNESDFVQEHQRFEEEFACLWIDNKLREVLHKEKEAYANYKLSEILKLWYGFLWNDFCANFLEWIKPGLKGKMSRQTLVKVSQVWLRALVGLHPFLPFITEEIATHLSTDFNGEKEISSVIYSSIDRAGLELIEDYDPNILERGVRVENILRQLRQIRKDLGLKKTNTLVIELYSIEAEYREFYSLIWPLFERLCGVEKYVDHLPFSVKQEYILGKDTLVIYVSQSKQVVENLSENERLVAMEDLAYLRKFLVDIEKKLANPKFLAHAAAEIVAREQKKKQDTMVKIQLLEDSLR